MAIGEPGAGYPLPWSVQTWLPGVRAIGTRGRTFSGHGRGGDLRIHDEWMQTCFDHSGRLAGILRDVVRRIQGGGERARHLRWRPP